MPREQMQVQRDLDLWESQLDKHLSHCATCDEVTERYCREGVEISVMVTRLMMEKMRLQVTGSDAIEDGPTARESSVFENDGERRP